MHLAAATIMRINRLLIVCGGMCYGLLAFAAAFRFAQPMLVVAACVLPLACVAAWYQPFLVSSLFVTFSYFRIQEAYPFVNALKPALVLGAASIGLVAVKCMISPSRDAVDTRLLRTFCLLSLLGVVGVAYPHALIRGGEGHGSDVVGIPLVMLSASFCALVWTKLLSTTAESPLPINIWLFTAYFSWLSVTTIVSFSPADSYNVWMNNPWKIAAMTLAISWMARSSWDFVLASSVFVLGGVLIAAMVIHNKIYSISLVNGTRVTIGRVEPVEGVSTYEQQQGLILNDPNDLALILLFPLAFALARVICRRGGMDATLSLIAAGLIMAGIVFTQSRGALLGLLAVLGVLFVQRYKLVWPAFAALVVIAPLTFVAMDFGSRDHAGIEQALEGELEDSASHRLEAWETAVFMFVDKPVRGVGVGNFNGLYRRYTRIWRGREMSTHSMWFQVLAELGIVGMGLFVSMIATSFFINAKTLKSLDSMKAPVTFKATGIALHAALAGTCVSGTFLSQAHTWPVYVIVGLIAALHNAVQAHKKRVQRHGERL